MSWVLLFGSRCVSEIHPATFIHLSEIWARVITCLLFDRGLNDLVSLLGRVLFEVETRTHTQGVLCPNTDPYHTISQQSKIIQYPHLSLSLSAALKLFLSLPLSSFLSVKFNRLETKHIIGNRYFDVWVKSNGESFYNYTSIVLMWFEQQQRYTPQNKLIHYSLFRVEQKLDILLLFII